MYDDELVNWVWVCQWFDDIDDDSPVTCVFGSQASAIEWRTELADEHWFDFFEKLDPDNFDDDDPIEEHDDYQPKDPAAMAEKFWDRASDSESDNHWRFTITKLPERP